MTPTGQLRKRLDELGINWSTDKYYRDTNTRWRVGDFEWRASEEKDGKLLIGCTCVKYLTPEQAIAATVGAGTCKDVCASVSEFTCSECGFNCDLTSWISLFDGDSGRHRHHHYGTPNYCPNCGRRVAE